MILFIVGLRAGKFGLVYAVLEAQLLELAVIVARAAQTLLVVVREQQLEGGLAILTNLRCIGEDLGAFSVDGVYARGD